MWLVSLLFSSRRPCHAHIKNGWMEGGRRRAAESPRLDSQQSEARKDTTEASEDYNLHLCVETERGDVIRIMIV